MTIQKYSIRQLVVIQDTSELVMRHNLLMFVFHTQEIKNKANHFLDDSNFIIFDKKWLV